MTGSVEGVSEHRVSTSVPLGWGPRLCISSKFPGNADAAGPGPLSETTDLKPHWHKPCYLLPGKVDETRLMGL